LSITNKMYYLGVEIVIVWEFFAGSRSFSKECEKRGYTTYTTDIEPFEKIDQIVSIFDFDIEEALSITGKPNIIWFSPPCKYFSVASCYYHWDYDGKKSYTPKSEGALIGLRILDKINELIEIIDPDYFIIENPRGLMRKMPHLKKYRRETAWYCQYGNKTAKPTDLWTNFPIHLKTCKNGNPDCHHERAPRGAISGIQGISGNYERSKVPAKLCNSILDQIEKPIVKEWFV